MVGVWKYILGIGAAVAVTVWLAVFLSPTQNLQLIACNVGQGDAILAVRGDVQILVDGGPGRDVLDCLGEHLPFWDRKIEVVVLTHPQEDHFGGLLEVFERYEVEYFLANALNSGSQGYQVLKNRVGGSGAKVVNATSGTVIRLGMIHLDILHPTQVYLAENGTWNIDHNGQGVLGSYDSRRDPNEFSIVAILTYKGFDALLTGDIQPPVTEVVSEEIEKRENISLEYIKIPHHGSKNGLTDNLLDTVDPSMAVISVGKNPWGHPNKEVLNLLKDKNIKVLRTDKAGDVIVESDGTTFWLDQ